MKISSIKKLNEKIPDWMKLPFGRIIRYQLIHNKAFEELYKKLEGSESATEAEVLNLIRQCLMQTVYSN